MVGKTYLTRKKTPKWQTWAWVQAYCPRVLGAGAEEGELSQELMCIIQRQKLMSVIPAPERLRQQDFLVNLKLDLA